MMFADLIDPVDFVEHLQSLGFEIHPDMALVEIVDLVRNNDSAGAGQGYFDSLASPNLNVHPDIRDALQATRPRQK